MVNICLSIALVKNKVAYIGWICYDILIVHLIIETQVSRLGTGFVHPMTFLIATLLSCEDASELISKMRTYRTSEENRSELIQIVKDSSDVGCNWDAKAD